MGSRPRSGSRGIDDRRGPVQEVSLDCCASAATHGPTSAAIARRSSGSSTQGLVVKASCTCRRHRVRAGRAAAWCRMFSGVIVPGGPNRDGGVMVLALISVLAVSLQAQRVETGFLDRTVSIAGQTYRYVVYVP